MGVVLKRALYFITCDGRMMYNTKLDESYITRHLIYNERPDNMLLADNKSCTYEQMSIFDLYLNRQYFCKAAGRSMHG